MKKCNDCGKPARYVWEEEKGKYYCIECMKDNLLQRAIDHDAVAALAIDEDLETSDLKGEEVLPDEELPIDADWDENDADEEKEDEDDE